MMTIHTLSADGYRYLLESVTRQDEEPERSVKHERIRGKLAAYYLDSGNPPGEWAGSLAAELGVSGEVTEEQMERLFGRAQHPVTGEQLGRRPPRFRPVAERVATREAQLAPSADVLAGKVERRLDDLTAGELMEMDGYALAALAERTGHRLTAEDAALAELDGHARRAVLTRAEQAAVTRDRVAGVDHVFSPVKSIQSLHALATITGDQQTRDQVESWIRSAWERTLRRMESDVAFGRLGAGGRAWVPVHGLAATAFMHRTSRAGDPALHWHVAVSSRVRVTDSLGKDRWVAVDTRVLHKATVSMSEFFNSEVEHAAMRDGFRFAVRDDQVQHGSRAVREIVGIPDELNSAWSRRRKQVETQYEVLLTQFRADHRRDPERSEQYKLAQQACLTGRPAKLRGQGPDDETAFWEGLARQALGDDADLRQIIDRARATPTPAQVADTLSAEQLAEMTSRTVAVVAERRTWWTARHLAAEAERQTRGILFASPADREQVVQHILDLATQPDRYLNPMLGHVVVAQRRSVVEEPCRLVRDDGQSVFREPSATEYTASSLLDAEDRMLRAAEDETGPRISIGAVEWALDQAAKHRNRLAPDQEYAVRRLATSGRLLELLIGPAGSGKTTTMRTLVEAAQRDGWTVIALAPSAVAAQILGEATGAKIVENTRQWEVLLATGRIQPTPKTLVLIDEASLGHTPTLDAITQRHVSAGGVVRLIGDHRQLTSPGAGGVLRWIHQQHGGVELTSLWRFHNDWEAAASLRLRDGDVTVVDEYLDHGRVRSGTSATMKDELYQWWLGQKNAGKTALMIVDSNADAADLSARARRDLTALGLVESTGVPLRDGNLAGRGDQIVTRKIDRTLRYNRGKDYVRNGDIWTVSRRHRDGSLTLRHAQNQGRIRLNSDYLTRHAESAYAVTGTRSQGATVAASGTLVRPGLTTRNGLYVPATRGQETNMMFVVTDDVLDLDLDPPAISPPDRSGDVRAALIAVIGREADDATAHERLTAAVAEEQSIRTLGGRYRYAVDLLFSARHATAEQAAAIDPDRTRELLAAIPPALADQVQTDPAWPALAHRLELVASLRHNPTVVLANAVAMRSFVGAESAAEVLHWRVGQLVPEVHEASRADNHTGAGGAGAAVRGERLTVAPWLPAVPADAPETLRDLTDYLTRTRGAIEARAAHLASAAAGTNAPWTAALGQISDVGQRRDDWLMLAARIATYRETFGVDDPRPLGDRPENASPGQANAYSDLSHDLASFRNSTTPEEPTHTTTDVDAPSAANTIGSPPDASHPEPDQADDTAATPEQTPPPELTSHETDQPEPQPETEPTYVTRRFGSLFDPTLAREIDKATRAINEARNDAVALRTQADQVEATADAGRGPAATALARQYADQAQRIQAITDAEPLAAAWRNAEATLINMEAEYADATRRLAATTRRGHPVVTGADRANLSTYADRLAGELPTRRAELDRLTARLGEVITGPAGPVHEWEDARRTHAEHLANRPDAIQAAVAIDRAAAQAYRTQADRHIARADRIGQRLADLRDEQQTRAAMPARDRLAENRARRQAAQTRRVEESRRIAANPEPDIEAGLHDTPPTSQPRLQSQRETTSQQQPQPRSIAP